MSSDLKFICQMVMRGFPHRWVLGLLPSDVFISYLDDRAKRTLRKSVDEANLEEEIDMLKNRAAVQWDFDRLGWQKLMKFNKGKQKVLNLGWNTHMELTG